MHDPYRSIHIGDLLTNGISLAILSAIMGALMGALGGFIASAFQISYPLISAFEFQPEHISQIKQITIQTSKQTASTAFIAGFVAGVVAWVISKAQNRTFNENIDKEEFIGYSVIFGGMLWLMINAICVTIEISGGPRAAEWSPTAHSATIIVALIISTVLSIWR